MNEKITLALVFAIIAAAGQIYGILSGHKSNNKQMVTEATNQAAGFARLGVKLDNVAFKVSENQRSFDKMNEKMDNISDQLARQDERINTLFGYYNDNKQRLDALEKGR